MSTNMHALLLTVVIALVTAALRFLPFAVFRNKTPEPILYLGRVLPFAIMAMLVVYCLKDVSFVAAPYGIPAVLSVLLVVLLHKWKHNTLLSILGGTLLYMLLIRLF